MSLTPKKVIVADDDPSVRQMLVQFLSKDNHAVLEAEDGAECLKLLKANPTTDFIVLDIVMPNKEGIETVIELKRDYPSVLILVISGGGRSNATHYLSSAKGLGADQVLAKPFSYDEFVATVEALFLSTGRNGRER